MNPLAHDLLALLVDLSEVHSRERVLTSFFDAVDRLIDGITIRPAEAGEEHPGETIPIATRNNVFGNVAIDGDTSALPAGVLPLLRNAVRILALILEKQDQDAVLADEKLRLELAVREHTAELSQANRELEEEIVEHRRTEEALRLAQKMEAIGELAGGVAHDFNNLLTVIAAQGELMEREVPPDSAVADSIKLIREAVGQATGVTRSLLTFSRKLRVERKPVGLCSVMERGLCMLRRSLPANIDLLAETSADPEPWVDADATQLQQVLLNLAVNARDAMLEGGTLRVAVRPTDPSSGSGARVRMCCLIVSDTGTGMSPEVQAHLFEPFFTTKARRRGTGLGLAVVHGIVTDHGGHIDVETAPGSGSTFTVYLPTIAAPAPSAAPSSRAAPAGRGERILVIDDHQQIRELIASSLASSGYEVLQAADGDACLEAVQREGNTISLVVLDVDLPKRGGLDCLRAIRARGMDTPVIVITGSVEAELGDQADDRTVLLPKPFQISELGRMVHDQLKAAPA